MKNKSENKTILEFEEELESCGHDLKNSFAYLRFRKFWECQEHFSKKHYIRKLPTTKEGTNEYKGRGGI